MSRERRTSTGSADTGGASSEGSVGKRTLTQRLQPRLRVGASSDVHEQAADAAAERVTSVLHGGEAAPAAPLAIGSVGGGELQGKDADAGEAPASVEAATRGGGGTALDPTTQSRMAGAFGGHDFSRVRVHTDGGAAASSADIGARAYAVGQDLFFGDGAYQPGTAEGDGLLAHELTHTVQQGHSGAAQRRVVQRFGGPGDPPSPAQAGPTATPGEDPIDNEGNHYRTVGGKSHITAAPVHPVPGHSGKFEALPANPLATFNALMAQVEAAKVTQLATADGFAGGRVPPADYKYWFAKVYYYVTQHELAAIRAGTYQYPMMKAQEVIWFNNAYMANVQRWASNAQAECEPHWRQAFTNAESQASTEVDTLTPLIGQTVGGGVGLAAGAAGGAVVGTFVFPGIGTAVGAGLGALGGALTGMMAGAPAANSLSAGARRVMAALLPSMQAHIRFDLPRAIAGCFQSYYAGLPGIGLGDFHPDFDAMGPVFDQAQTSLNPEIAAATGVPARVLTQAATHAFPAYFDVAAERRTTWTKSAELVAAHTAGATNQASEDRMRAVTGAGSPVSGASAYQVDGHDISGFDWGTNPGTAPPQTMPTPPARGGH